MNPVAPLVLAVFVASVLGSFHCAGMCGAFLALATGSPDKGAPGGWRTPAACQGAYHLGRLVTYVALGVAAGAAGQLLNLAGALAGLSRAAAVLAGATMIFFAAIALLRARGVRVGRMSMPGPWVRLIQRAHQKAMARPPVVRAAAIGLLTTLLPCGWLYAFAVTAAGTASPLIGAAVMAFFWAGTLPMLVGLGVGLRAFLGPLGRRAPALTAAVLAVAGLYTLVGRAALVPADLAGRLHGSPATHCQRPTAAAAVPVAAAAGADHGEELPCCRK